MQIEPKKCSYFLCFRFMIDEMMPCRITESESLANFLGALNSKFKLPSRRTFMRVIKKKAEAGLVDIINIMEDIKYFATTADCWTAHKRSFLGMTAHWIDTSTLKRKKGVLACKEVPVSHTADVLANAMLDIHQKFNIESKVII